MLKTILSLTLCTCIVSCAPAVKFTERNVNIVMAKDAERGKGPIGITDTFTLEGKIVAYSTFTWDEVQKEGGYHNITAKWYSGEKLVSSRDYRGSFTRPPYYVWFWTNATTFGPGKAKVEIYADGLLVGTKNFEVVTK